MDDPWKQLPRAAAIVYVGVLAAGSARSASAGEQAAAPASEASEPSPAPGPIAPTCGPACHNGGEEPMPIVEAPPPDEPDPVAPTCGPECHDSDWSTPEPPPLPPEKKGCTVESVADERGLVLLGFGLLAGVSMRRRRRGEESQ